MSTPSTPSAPLPPGQFGPVLRGGRPRRRLRRTLLGLGTTLAVAVVAGALTVAGVLLYGTQAIDRIRVPNLATPDPDDPDAVDIDELTEVLNLLVVGSDSREGLSEEQLARLGTESAEGDRTDTIMLVQLDPRRDQVVVLSFPRDLLVTRCDSSRGRINAAFGLGEQTGVGGPACLVRTVRDFTGIAVNHFVQVDFVGFVRMVDALGGVTLFIEEPGIRDAASGLDLPGGCVELDGIDALSFVRARGLDNDFGRIARQQRFIRELVAEATSVGTLVNIPRLFSLVDAAASAVDTDEGLTVNQMRRIAFSLRDLDADRIDTRTVPGVARRIDGVAYVVAKEQEAEQLFQAFREGELIPEGIGTQGVVELTAADVPALAVLNGAGIAGVAAHAAEQLDRLGFAVAETGNADSFDFVRTQVVYAPDRVAEAELVAEALGGAALVPGLASAGQAVEGQDTEIVVVLGEDYDRDAMAARAAEVDAADEPGAQESPAAEPGEVPGQTPPTYAGAEPNEQRC